MMSGLADSYIKSLPAQVAMLDLLQVYSVVYQH